MSFSDDILKYIQKHYSPISNRLTQILIIINGLIAITALLFALNLDVVSISVAVIVEGIAAAILLLLLFQRIQNKEIEQLEYAILLNRNLVDRLSPYYQKQLLILLNQLFPSGVNNLKQFKKYFPDVSKQQRSKKILKLCLKMIDPENKTEYEI